MGSGVSGRYYSSHGSKTIHHQALIHSFDGRFTYDSKTKALSRMISGGHGQSNIDYLASNGIKVKIVKTYPNGFRVGNVPIHKNKLKREKNGQTWFPRTWSQKDMVKAGEHVSKLKKNRHVKDGVAIYGMYKNVELALLKRTGKSPQYFQTSINPQRKEEKRNENFRKTL